MENLDDIFDGNTPKLEEDRGLTWGQGILLGVIFLGLQGIAAIPLAFTGMTDIGMATTLILSYIGTIYIGSRCVYIYMYGLSGLLVDWIVWTALDWDWVWIWHWERTACELDSLDWT